MYVLKRPILLIIFIRYLEAEVSTGLFHYSREKCINSCTIFNVDLCAKNRFEISVLRTGIGKKNHKMTVGIVACSEQRICVITFVMILTRLVNVVHNVFLCSLVLQLQVHRLQMRKPTMRKPTIWISH